MGEISRRGGLTRKDLEVVIRRAAELEAQAGSDVLAIGEEDLLRIASEVGLSESSVRRALAEHYGSGAGLLVERGWASRLCGAGLVTATRRIERPAPEVQEALESHFKVNESLLPVRRLESESLWEPDRGVIVSVLRSLDLFGRGYQLARKARTVALRVIPLEEGSSQVTLTADLGNERAAWFWVLGLAGGGSAAAAATVFIIGLPGVPDLAALGSPALVCAAVWLARLGYRRAVERIRVSLEGLLDHLEQGEPLERQRPGWLNLLR